MDSPSKENNGSSFGDHLREALDARDWSQAQLVREMAARTGNAPESERSAVRGYLRGDTRPSLPRARLLAEILENPELLRVDAKGSASARIEARLEVVEDVLRSVREGQEQGIEELQLLQNEVGTLQTEAETLQTEFATLRSEVSSLREMLDARLPDQSDQQRTQREA